MGDFSCMLWMGCQGRYMLLLYVLIILTAISFYFALRLWRITLYYTFAITLCLAWFFFLQIDLFAMHANRVTPQIERALIF